MMRKGPGHMMRMYGYRQGAASFMAATERYNLDTIDLAALETRVLAQLYNRNRGHDPRNNYGRYAGRITKWKR